jgi:hypothetical protein
VAIVAGDLKFFQSELEGSSGGALSTLEIPLDQMCLIFPDVTRGQAKYGAVEYKKVFAINMSALDTLSAGRLWLLMQPLANIKMAIGVGSPTDTDGSLIEYTSPSSKKTAVYLGDMAPSQSIPIWIRRVVPLGAPEFERGFFQLALTGQV